MHTAAFVVPGALPLQRTERNHAHRGRGKHSTRRIRRTRCMTNEPPEPNGKPSEQEPRPQPPAEPIIGRFDASSDTDAFGRDPKKETEFWKDHAKSVLQSPEVREAIEQHAKNGGDGLTEEQRAYRDFVRKLDEEKAQREGEGQGDGNGDANGY